MALQHSLLLCSLFIPITVAQASSPAGLLSTYPICAQQCFAEVNVTYPTSGNDICGPLFRSRTAGCEKVTCSPADYSTTQSLAQQLCGAVYANNTFSGPSVISAITSATNAAATAVAGKDPANSASYPLCAQGCQQQALAAAGAGSIANRSICTDSTFLNVVGPCEDKDCNPVDRQTIRYLGYVLCESTGIGNTSQVISNVTATETGTAPIASFTGGVARMEEEIRWAMLWVAAFGVLTWGVVV